MPALENHGFVRTIGHHHWVDISDLKSANAAGAMIGGLFVRRCHLWQFNKCASYLNLASDHISKVVWRTPGIPISNWRIT